MVNMCIIYNNIICVILNTHKRLMCYMQKDLKRYIQEE